MLVITGASGALNGATVDHLLDRVPATEIVVVARDVTAVQHLAERGVGVRHGDYAEPAGLPAAFAGADQLLLVSASDPAADTVALHRAAIEGAVAAGVGRVLYTSHQGAAPDSPFGPARDHHATEQLLAESGLRWTALRNGFYAHSLNFLLGPWRETGRITVPADGPVSWTARADQALAAALIMTSAQDHDGPVTLTAAAAPTFVDVAATAAELLGRPVELAVVDPKEWVASRVAAGQPEPAVRFLLSVHQAAAAGFFRGVDPLLGDLLGHAPQTVRDALATPAAHG